jgi:hypothetical protein
MEDYSRAFCCKMDCDHLIRLAKLLGRCQKNNSLRPAGRDDAFTVTLTASVAYEESSCIARKITYLSLP